MKLSKFFSKKPKQPKEVKLKPITKEDNLYFIGLSNVPNAFVHPKGKEFIIKPGTVGACLWKEETADLFIQQQQAAGVGKNLIKFNAMELMEAQKAAQAKDKNIN